MPLTPTQLFTELKTLGLPVAYGGFSQPTNPPYIIYQFSYSNDLVADNRNCIPLSNYQVELYTKTKDPIREPLVENKLKDLCLPYRKIETLIESENLRQIIYEIQLTGG
ncbi:MAG: hypothetical protein AB1815_02580 [Bacillota bacterium]